VVVGMVVRHRKMLHYNITGVHVVARLEGRLLERPNPSCPAKARRRGIQYAGLLESIIDVSGILGHPPQCASAHKAGDDKSEGVSS
jgi:hypothetical protein